MQEAGLIHKQMVAILRDTEAIGKDLKNQTQGFMFRGIDQVYNELHPVFARHGVYIAPSVVQHDHFEEQTKSGNKMHHHFLTVDFAFTAEDGSSVVMRGMGEASDSGDKGINKCLSIALKYALFQSLLIPTEEEKDPDASAYQTNGRKRKAEEPEPQGVKRNTPEEQRAFAQQKVTEMKQAKPATTTDFKMLEAFQTIKKAIGDKEYYRILGANGFEKSNEITDHQVARRVYLEMAELKKAMDMRRDDPEAATALFDLGQPSAALRDPK